MTKIRAKTSLGKNYTMVNLIEWGTTLLFAHFSQKSIVMEIHGLKHVTRAAKIRKRLRGISVAGCVGLMRNC